MRGLRFENGERSERLSQEDLGKDKASEVVGVVGLGLIGGSIGLALRDSSLRVVGCDLNPAHAETALKRQCVDEVCPFEEVAKAGVVFLAVPPGSLVDVAERAAQTSPPTTVITDCGSVKAEVAEWALKSKTERFVPGHPMAGHEKGGPEYASSWLFRNARWLLTPTKITDRAAVAAVEKLVKKMGATPVRLDASEHDRHVALLSHLPHVLASSLVLLSEDLSSIEVAGGSWRDWTRVAGVDPQLWSQIFLGNRKELARAIDVLIVRLSDVRGHLAEGDATALLEELKKTQLVKARQEMALPKPKPAGTHGKTRKVRR